MEPNRPYDQDNRPPTYYYGPKKKRRGGFLILWALIFSLIGGVVGSVVTYKYMPAPAVGGTQVPQTQLPADTTRKHEAGVVESVAQRAMPSVVGITTSTTKNTLMGPMAVQGSGSGFIISEDGYILSNAHVVGAKGNKVKVLLNDQTEAEGKVVWSDETLDLGLVKIAKKGLTPLPMGDSDGINIGETAVAIGNPLGLDFQRSVTSGVISGLNRNIGEVQGNYMDGLIQTDASINAGNSGGPLINAYGQVIGIVTAKYSSSGVEGLGFAIPVNDAVAIANDLMKNGTVTDRAQLGITLQTIPDSAAQYYNMPDGAYVNSVNSGSCAEKAGLKAGDIITAIDDTTVSSGDALRSALRGYSAGESATLTVSRNGETLTLTVTFDRASDSTK